MSEKTTLPAPELPVPSAMLDGGWEAERLAFLRLAPGLSATHAGLHVAIAGGQVVASGEDRLQVALEAYARTGYAPVFVGRVGDTSRRVARMASPRVVRPHDVT